MFSGNIAAILPKLDLWIVLAVLPQYCQKDFFNLHAKSSIAAILLQYCQKMLQQYCCTILPEALYFGNGNDLQLLSLIFSSVI